MQQILGAFEAVDKIRKGLISSEQLVRRCLEQIERLEAEVQAWAHLDPDYALEQARKSDKVAGEAVRQGQPLKPLHGIPVGIKDIIDTRDLPTENGTVLHAGRRPEIDAALVTRLKEAGAVILGKTVTTELAVFHPGKTRNPHNPNHTPGGSSSGSAAAVACGMAPLAVGTQTNGSIIRPASFCGVYGYKPTYGFISRHRVLLQSRPLDQVGVYGRSIEDAALIAETLIGYDANDPDSVMPDAPELVEVLAGEPPIEAKLAFIKTPVWQQADLSARSALEGLVEALGDAAVEISLPEMFDGAHEHHRQIMEADLARSFAAEYRDGADQLSDILTQMMERGREVSETEYKEAVAAREIYYRFFDELLERYDAIITPATTGEAPEGLDSTGSPVFCTIWTLCGMPAISLPLLQGENGLPLGVQVVGARGADARLLSTARWLENRMQPAF
jgi:Asp-tRNA(Asn)/Glu-tRNA(Gln) amidotransferase A subunit family amidase